MLAFLGGDVALRVRSANESNRRPSRSYIFAPVDPLTEKEKTKGKADTGPSATAEERLGGVIFYSFVVGLAYLVFEVFLPFMAPLLWAGVIVLCTYGWHLRLKTVIGNSAAAATSTATVTLLIVVPTMLVSIA